MGNKLKGLLTPDRYFNGITDITPEFLRDIGLRGVILDIDNTLVPYSVSKPTAEVLHWLSGLREAGITVAIASNNGKERVERFNEGIGALVSHKSGKPRKKALLKLLARAGLEAGEVALIGDQLFTDIAAAKNAGLFAILVKPIDLSCESLFIKFKRALEKPFLVKYFGKNNIYGVKESK